MSELTTLKNTLDLTQSFPRSPGKALGPYLILARILDKCRASIAGTNGEYNFDCPLDQRFFDFFQINANDFKTQVASGKTDDEMLQWVNEKATSHSPQALMVWSYNNRTSRPENDEEKVEFEQIRQENCPNSPYVETWFQLLDAEEGRF